MNGSTIYTPEELGADVDEEGNVIEAQQGVETGSDPQDRGWRVV